MKKSVPKMHGLAMPALLGGLLLLPGLGHATPAAPERLALTLLQAADAPVTGRITDEKGAGIPGVNVMVKGTSMGTQTNADGRYSIEAPAGATLVFSFVGYASQEVPVGGRTTVDARPGRGQQGAGRRGGGGLPGPGPPERDQRREQPQREGSHQDAGAHHHPGPAGPVAGVQVQGSGGPGDAPVIMIRGIGSAGNSSSAPLYVIDGLWTDNIRDLNPNDIETLNVLKDASSTAIYGSRGANGVMQITTKKGKAGTPTIGFNAYAGVDNVYKRYKLTNASEWADRARAGLRQRRPRPAERWPEQPGGRRKGPGGAFNPNIDTDWQKEFFQTGRVEDYNVNFSGGTPGDKSASNFLISGDYFHQEGIVKGPDFKRYSLRLNSGLTRGRFKFQENAQLTHINTHAAERLSRSWTC